MKIFKCVLMLMLSLLLSIPGIAEEKKKTSVPEKSGLGDWWHHSSLKYKPMPDKLLFHTELQYADRKLTGNDEGYVHNGSASFYIRKHRFTDRVTYSINKYDIDQSDGGHTDKDYQMFEELLRFDLTEYLYPEAGIIWETDSKNLIEDRYIYYGGVGSLLSFKRHQINIALCYGLQHEEYDPIVEQLIGIGEDDSRIIYFYQTYDWLIRDKIAFQEARLIHRATRDRAIETTGK